jgi:multidrug resistance efflux pump
MPKQRRIILIAVLVIVLMIGAAAGYRFWYQPTMEFFNTTDAAVTGSLVRIAAPASGQVNDLYIDVGTSVKKDDALATIKVVSTAASASSAPSVPRLLARVSSPITGTIASRSVSVGDTIATGQAIATIVDLSRLWVIVNVDESRAAEIRVGQSADVEIGSVGQTFRGKVSEIGSATTDLTSAGTISLNSSDTTKKVPVKVTFDYANYRLVPGLTANVTIYTHATSK